MAATPSSPLFCCHSQESFFDQLPKRRWLQPRTLQAAAVSPGTPARSSAFEGTRVSAPAGMSLTVFVRLLSCLPAAAAVEGASAGSSGTVPLCGAMWKPTTCKGLRCKFQLWYTGHNRRCIV